MIQLNPAKLLRPIRCFLVAFCAASATAGAFAGELEVSFNRDIRPILSDKCFACHGPDAGQREADLRLDQRESATAKRDDDRVIVPGNTEASTLLHRVSTPDVDELMPPPDEGQPLTAAEIDLLRRWIEQGAPYQTHWSLTPLTRPPVPDANDKRGRNPIDAFVEQRLRQEGVRPAAQADPRVLVRRLSFDLTGLAPQPDEVDRFVDQPTDDAYHQLVDSLLSSPHYGERMAVYWLDLVRYADTLGFHGDQDRSVSPYRDYVIRAFNDNLPFDQFTIEQLAGDLLPDASLWQKVASTYNRLNRASAEGGVQPKEYLAKYAADRVRTAGQVWLGSTFGCAECHDHKFDPFTMRDFYSFAAFFADITELGIVPGAKHLAQMPVPTPEQAQALQQLDAQLSQAETTYRQALAKLSKEQQAWEEALAAKEEAKDKQKKKKAKQDDLTAIAHIPRAKRKPEQIEQLETAFAKQSARLKEPYEIMTDLRARKKKLQQSIVTTLVTQATTPRTMRVLPRGNWMDDSGDVVEPAVPRFLPQPADAGKRRLNRLDLARWLVDRDNPLVARTFVNRVWMLLFGNGLARSVDDLGSQGEPPSHPELLDWLSVEFIESGWDVKHLVRLIVTSDTYRRSSQPREDLLKVDPYNLLLARQGRWRIDAEMIRDQVLQVSGLLVETIGGRSAKPYQPAGYWAQLNFPKRKYQADTGPGQYRRGLYTHWQRTFLHPSLMAFDAPVREECTAQRPRSNTPLQSLVLLNDPTYVEAARVLAERVLREGPKENDERIGWLYRQVLQRRPTEQEQRTLVAFVARQQELYRGSPEQAEAILEVGLAPRDEQFEPVDVAAWTAVTRVVLNLHETITRY